MEDSLLLHLKCHSIDAFKPYFHRFIHTIGTHLELQTMAANMKGEHDCNVHYAWERIANT